MKWMEALKEWNKTQPKWKIPKKDTEAYKQVKALMDGKAKKATKKKPTKKSKAKKTEKVETFEEIFEEMKEEKPKRKRGRPRKNKD